MARDLLFDPIFRGEDVRLDFTAYTTDTGSTPQDITGWTLIFTVAEQANSTSKLITKTCTHVVDANGTFYASLASADTDIAPGRYWCDVYRTDTGYLRCLGSGPFTLEGVAYKPAAV